MNKILFVLSCNLHWAPYYIRYENIMKRMGLKYDVVLWNREGIKDTTYGEKIEYNVADQTNNGSAKKIFKFTIYNSLIP